jgi:hypothetical protein
MAYIRNPADVIGRLLLSLSVGLVIGLVFINANAGELSVLLHDCCLQQRGGIDRYITSREREAETRVEDREL